MSNLLLLVDDYLPHSTRVAAKMCHELARELIQQGHTVTVVTPKSDLDSNYVQKELDGVNVWYFKNGDVKVKSKIKRAVRETLLSRNAWTNLKPLFSQARFDGIIYYSPSIFWGALVRKLRQRYHCESYLILRDIFPQWAIDAGMIKKGSLIQKYFNYFERLSYRQADRIGLMSEANIEFFESLHGTDYPTEVLRNWASLDCSSKAQHTSSVRTQLGLEGKVIFFYGGNIGHAQDMANLMRLAKGMTAEKEAHFLFVGQGDEVDLINKLANDWGLTNFSYLPSIDQKSFDALLNEVDVGLFSLSNKHTTHNFPGKLLGYMVHKIPILGSVNKGNDLIDLVNKNDAGIVHVNGEDDKFLASAKELLNSAEQRTQLGECGYGLLTKEFSVTAIATQIKQSLCKSAG